MSPVPAEAICRTCRAELHWSRMAGGWVHSDHNLGMLPHAATAMSQEERAEWDEKQRELLASLPLIDRNRESRPKEQA